MERVSEQAELRRWCLCCYLTPPGGGVGAPNTIAHVLAMSKRGGVCVSMSVPLASPVLASRVLVQDYIELYKEKSLLYKRDSYVSLIYVSYKRLLI